jgi:hypothetical protein
MVFRLFPSSKPGLHSQTDSEERKNLLLGGKTETSSQLSGERIVPGGERKLRTNRLPLSLVPDWNGSSINVARVNIDIESLRVEDESPHIDFVP